MTGPEHYHEAEKLLGMVGDLAHGDVRGPEMLAEAQVHATLALAAATALLPFTNPDSGGDGANLDAWRETAGRQA